MGTRKAITLLECGADVTVISPAVTDRLHDLAAAGRITLKRRTYRSADLSGKFLVIGATDDEFLNRQISADAERLNTLCNIADRPAVCNFILPSIVQRDDLVITISTSGQSPALAKKLREALEKQFGEEYGILLNLMGTIRKKLLSQAHEPEAHKHIFEKLLDSDLLEMIRGNKKEAIDTRLFDILGPGYRYDQLMWKRKIESE